MLEALASVLTLLMNPFYDLTGNWWITIFLFTVLIKIILMPLALWVQKNSIKMVQIMPEINRIKAKYYGDSETIGEKQTKLNKEQGYHPLLSLIPLAVQIIILFGLVDVIHGITDNGAPGTEFLGMIPFEDGGYTWIMPVLAGLSAVIMGFAQNRINPLQREQSKAEKNMTNGLSIGLSLVLGVFVATGMAFYWICSNLTSIVVQVVCNVAIKPKKYIDYEDLAESRIPLEEINALSEKKKWWKRDPLAKREKADYKRFFDIVNKHIVFYAESGGYYKYFKSAIEYLLENSDIYIHYVTNDPNDYIFTLADKEPRIFPYYISEKKAITLLMKISASVVVMTTEDFDNYYLKRSYIDNDTEYVFMFHHMTSTHLVATKNAYANFDHVLCVGPHQIKELRKAEELYGTKTKNLVECGYPFLDSQMCDYENIESEVEHIKPRIIIAPSWQEDNICDSCIDDILSELLCEDWQITVRPHPEYVKRYKQRWDALINRYANVPDSQLYFDCDYRTGFSIFTADMLITDWSSAFLDLGFVAGKPSLFIDTPMKITNKDWKDLEIEPTDISLRNKVGVSLSQNDLSGQILNVVKDMIYNNLVWKNRIYEIRDAFVYNLGHSGDVAGEFLLSKVLEKQNIDDIEESCVK